MVTKLVCLLISSYLLLAGDYHVVSGFTQVTYSSESSSTECGQSDPLLMEALSKIHQELGPPGCNPPRNRSCQEILYCFPSAPSGYHEIHVPNGSLVQVYCDMEGTNCGGQGGWMRVTNVNMSQSGASCPQGLTCTEEHVRTDSLWTECYWLSRNIVLYTRSQLLTSVWPATRIPVWYLLLTWIITILMTYMLMGCPSHMILHHPNTSGHMLLDSVLI